MHLVNPSSHQREKIAWAAQGLLLALASIFSVVWVVFMGVGQGEDRDFSKAPPLPKIDETQIGQGMFALSPPTKSSEMMQLVQELVLIGKDTRPGSSEVCLGLKTTGFQQKVVCGEKMVFRFNEKEFALTPLAFNNDGVAVQIAWDLGQEEVALPLSSLFQRSMDDEEYMQSWKKGKLWGPDMFLQRWGGDEYSSLSSKHKIEMNGKVYFLSVGDRLWWDGDEWRSAENIDGAPSAKIVSSTAQGIKVEIWDATGYASSVVQLLPQQPLKQLVKQEEIMTAVRSRSPFEITCQLGKRRVTVKEGDWWVKTEGRWRPLKNTSDLEAFLHHEIQGELFIFEKIENGKDKVTLKGHSFDKMRTVSQPIALVFNTEKKVSSHPIREISRASLYANNKAPMPPIQHQNSDGEEK